MGGGLGTRRWAGSAALAVREEEEVEDVVAPRRSGNGIANSSGDAVGQVEEQLAEERKSLDTARAQKRKSLSAF